MDREGGGFAFARKSMKKLKAGIFDDPQIRELVQDPMFDKALSEAELSAWQSLKSIVTSFLGNHWSAKYEKEIAELLKSFRQLGAQTSVKLHFQRSHLNYFLKNCENLSAEHGEHFHQDTRIMEEHYQGQWDVNFLGDYCWCLKWDTVVAEHTRKRPFIYEWLLFCIFQFIMAQFELFVNISILNFTLFNLTSKSIVIILFNTVQVRACILKNWYD